MMKIRISDKQDIPVNITGIRKLVRCVFVQEGLSGAPGEVSIMLVDDEGMRELNRKFLSRNRPTDVIAFRMWEGPFHQLHPEILGDVVVNVAQARRLEKDFQTELDLYIVHGLLHLLGYVDDTGSNARVMQERCDCILKKCEIKRGK